MANDTDRSDVLCRFNPGRIEPTDAAWDASRKPLVAAWQTPSGKRFFTINLHLASKGGSSSSQGDARPPINGGVDQRISQVQLVAVSGVLPIFYCFAPFAFTRGRVIVER